MRIYGVYNFIVFTENDKKSINKIVAIKDFVNVGCLLKLLFLVIENEFIRRIKDESFIIFSYAYYILSSSDYFFDFIDNFYVAMEKPEYTSTIMEKLPLIFYHFYCKRCTKMFNGLIDNEVWIGFNLFNKKLYVKFLIDNIDTVNINSLYKNAEIIDKYIVYSEKVGTEIEFEENKITHLKDLEQFKRLKDFMSYVINDTLYYSVCKDTYNKLIKEAEKVKVIY